MTDDKEGGNGVDFEIDGTRGTVLSDRDTERTFRTCDRCDTKGWHMLIYAFAPPSDFERWRCDSCRTVATLRGGPA